MNKVGLMNKKIPTLVGLLILVAGLVGGIFLVNSRTSFQTKAGPTESPKNIKISNRGAGGFSVNWTTDTPMTGYVKYSEDPAKINLPAGDVRDQISGTSQNYTNHYVNITGLGANKTYYFLIGSGSQTYNDNEKPYQTRTLVSSSSPPEDVISGKVLGSDSSPVNGAIVFVDIEAAETLTTITKTDGTWRINLSTARTKEGTVLTLDPKKTLLSIFVQAGTSGTATAITNTEKARPVPDILLGKNQSFVDGGEMIADISSTEASRSGSFDLTESQLSSGDLLDSTEAVTFLNPAIVGELIATISPEFKIKLATGSGIIFSVGEQSSLPENTINVSGVWTWTPEFALESGLNTLKIEYLDDSKTKKEASRAFNVLAIGDIAGLPAFTATPSAVTPTPTEAFTMPETDSEELDKSGTFEQSILIMVSGLMLVLVGNFLKKKWQ